MKGRIRGRRHRLKCLERLVALKSKRRQRLPPHPLGYRERILGARNQSWWRMFWRGRREQTECL